MRCFILILILLALGGSRLPAQGSLQLEAATDRQFYMANATHKVYLEMRISSAPQPAATEIATIRNVALVLDRSGSMAGGRIQALREAVTAALATLGETDIVSIVAFDSEVETLVEARPRSEISNLDALLARIEPTGGSALYDALNQGAAQLRRRAGPATTNYLILVTDGPPTKGPREIEDFTRLAGVFADERIAISSIGVGDDFNEDLLAVLARAGNGRFRYAAEPSKISQALQAEVSPRGALVARDVTLKVEMLSGVDELESYGWVPVVLKENQATYQLPYLFAGQELAVFLGAEMRPRISNYRFARLHLSWTDAADGQPRSIEQEVSVGLENESTTLRDSANAAVVRTVVATVISGGLQKAIEQIDKGDFRRALRALRQARSDAVYLNYNVNDPEAEANIRLLDSYLAEVQGRGLNQLDRKVLRSGLFNQLQIPVAEESSER